MQVLTDLTPTPETQDIIYNCLDTMHTFGLKNLFDNAMPPWAKYTARYQQLMLGPIMTMMRRGILIDTAKRDEVVVELQAEQQRINTNFNTLCESLFDCTFNINSFAQLQNLFYDFLGIPKQTKSKKGVVKVGTDREILERIVASYPRGAPFALHILVLRDLERQIGFLSYGLSPASRFHCAYNVAGTDTFRLSSSEHPLRIGGNAQNLPKAARRIFKPDPGYTMCQADQQGAEARIVAYRTGDKNYMHAVESGDSHTLVASMIFGFEPKRELAEQKYYRDYSYRDITKKGAHGTNYYGKPFAIASQLKVEVKLAEEFQAKYLKAFPGIADWHASCQTKLRNDGAMQTAFGIKRYFWDRRWDDATLRKAIAFDPQSCVGVLTNVGLYRLWHEFEGKPGAPLQILANGHDAAIFQVRTDMLNEVLPRALELLTFPLDIEDIHGNVRKVIIPWEVEIGENWGAYKPDKNPSGLKKWSPPNAA